MCVRQVDHQAQCLLMARAWGGPGATRLEHWEAVEVAAGLHDEGWRSVDDEPGSQATVDFTRIAAAEHCALYEQGIAHVEAVDARAGLLVSMHGQGLHQARLGLDGRVPPIDTLDAPQARFAQAQVERQERIARALGDDIDLALWRWDAYRLLQAWDRLSLYLVWRGLPDGRAGEIGPAPLAPGNDGTTLRLEPVGRRTVLCDPFPFDASEVRVPVVERVIGEVVGPSALGAALAEAREEEVEYVICRGGA